MGRTTRPIILLIILIGSLAGCKKDEPISYDEAIRQCKTGSGKFFNGKDTVLIYQTSPKCVINAQFPMFLSSFIDGRPVNEEYFTDKINVVNFWFIGCHPCEAEMPGFNALVEKYKGRPVNFIAISRNQPDDIQIFLKDHPFNVDHVGFGELITRDIYHMAWGYPFTIVADNSGRILFADHTGGSDSMAVQRVQDELIPVIDSALEKM